MKESQHFIRHFCHPHSLLQALPQKPLMFVKHIFWLRHTERSSVEGTWRSMTADAQARGAWPRELWQPNSHSAVLGRKEVGVLTHLEPFLGSKGGEGVMRRCPFWEAPPPTPLSYPVLFKLHLQDRPFQLILPLLFLKMCFSHAFFKIWVVSFLDMYLSIHLSTAWLCWIALTLVCALMCTFDVMQLLFCEAHGAAGTTLNSLGPDRWGFHPLFLGLYNWGLGFRWKLPW